MLKFVNSAKSPLARWQELEGRQEVDYNIESFSNAVKGVLSERSPSN